MAIIWSLNELLTLFWRCTGSAVCGCCVRWRSAVRLLAVGCLSLRALKHKTFPGNRFWESPLVRSELSCFLSRSLLITELHSAHFCHRRSSLRSLSQDKDTELDRMFPFSPSAELVTARNCWNISSAVYSAAHGPHDFRWFEVSHTWFPCALTVALRIYSILYLRVFFLISVFFPPPCFIYLPAKLIVWHLNRPFRISKGRSRRGCGGLRIVASFTFTL